MVETQMEREQGAGSLDEVEKGYDLINSLAWLQRLILSCNPITAQTKTVQAHKSKVSI
jgi:hypothetical protein